MLALLSLARSISGGANQVFGARKPVGLRGRLIAFDAWDRIAERDADTFGGRKNSLCTGSPMKGHDGDCDFIAE